MFINYPKHPFPRKYIQVLKKLQASGILIDIIERYTFPDEPFFYQYACTRPAGNDTTTTAAGFGCSDSQNEAYKIAISEAIEHYCILYEPKDEFVHASYNELGSQAIDPTLFVPFSQKQLQEAKYHRFRVNHATRLNWVKGKSLISGKEILIPAGVVYAKYNALQYNEPQIQLPNNTGAASGESYWFGVYKGICELIERDAYMISFLSILPKSLIDVRNDEVLNRFIEKIERYRLEIYFLKTSLEFSPTAITAIMIDRTGSGPAVCTGLGGDLDPRHAILTAGYEAVRRHISARDRFFRQANLPMPKKYTFDWFLLEKQQLWSSPLMIRKAESFINKKNTVKFSTTRGSYPHDYEGRVKLLLHELAQKNHDVFVVDVTVPQVKELGFTVVKILIPDLVPLWRDERYPYLGYSRLQSIPKAHGVTPPDYETMYTDAFSVHPF